MQKKIAIVLLLFSLTSCATIFTNKTYDLKIKSNADAQVKIDDSIYTLPNKIRVTRSKNDLPVILISNAETKTYTLKSSLTPNFVFGNLAFIWAAPAGYLVDLTNQKKYGYGKSVFLNANDTITEIKTPLRRSRDNFKSNVSSYFRKDFPTNKGQINLTLSIPWLNTYYFQPVNESSKSATGFLGFSSGLEYYHSSNRFASLNASVAIDSPVFVPAPVDYYGETDFLYALSLSLTENHKFNRYTLGYGVQYAQHVYRFENDDYETDTTLREPFVKTNHAIGFVTNAYFQLSRSFYVGVNYKPTLFDISTSKLLYEHTINIDLAWKIKLKK